MPQIQSAAKEPCSSFPKGRGGGGRRKFHITFAKGQIGTPPPPSLLEFIAKKDYSYFTKFTIGGGGARGAFEIWKKKRKYLLIWLVTLLFHRKASPPTSPPPLPPSPPLPAPLLPLAPTNPPLAPVYIYIYRRRSSYVIWLWQCHQDRCIPFSLFFKKKILATPLILLHI